MLIQNNLFGVEPGLFGLEKGCSNRDFSKAESWGKNKFNNAFPVSLSCYMASKGFKPVYLRLNKNAQIEHQKIDVSSIFGLDPFAPELFFSFETDYTPYRTIVTGKFPRTDLVTLNKGTGSNCLQSLEVKLRHYLITQLTSCQKLSTAVKSLLDPLPLFTWR